jgi:hypothetical protein
MSKNPALKAIKITSERVIKPLFPEDAWLEEGFEHILLGPSFFPGFRTELQSPVVIPMSVVMPEGVERLLKGRTCFPLDVPDQHNPALRPEDAGKLRPCPNRIKPVKCLS